MMPRTLSRHWSFALLSLVFTTGVAAPAAQDGSPTRHAVLSADRAREIERIAVEASTAAVTAVDEALRSLAAGAGIDAAGDLSARAQQDRDLRVERTDRTSRTIALGPSGLLELRNIAGEITVTAGSGRDVVLEIRRSSRARTEADAARGLEEVQVQVTHLGERATIEAVYPRGRTPYQVSTTYTVSAPRGTRLTARSISGNVSVRGIEGDLSVEVVSGAIDIRDGSRISQARAISGNVHLANIDTDGAVSAGTVSGTVVVEHVRARRLSAESVSGTVRATDVRADGAALRSLSGSVEYAGPLAPNGRYEFDSHSGTVRIVAEGDTGFELQARSFSGRIRPEGLTLQSISTDRGQLRATIGNGSAVVLAKTFSGDVIVARK